MPVLVSSHDIFAKMFSHRYYSTVRISTIDSTLYINHALKKATYKNPPQFQVEFKKAL